MKNVYCASTKQHGDMKSDVLRSENVTTLQAQCASALTVLLEWVKSPTIPTDT